MILALPLSLVGLLVIAVSVLFGHRRATAR
jgi:hypothetical protein